MKQDRYLNKEGNQDWIDKCADYMDLVEFKAARKKGGGVPSKEKIFNESRSMALNEASKAIGIKREVLEAMIKG